MTDKQSNRCGAKHKQRLMTVKIILEEESDQSHRFSVKQLLDRLGLPHTEANQRAIRSDIKTLQDFGIAITREKHRTFEYYVSSRRFQQNELKMLIDIVQSSRSIDEQTSRDLVESILALGSHSESQSLKAEIRLGRRPKTKNDQVFRYIEVIQGALSASPRHKVSFAYLDLGFDLKKQSRYRETKTETPILLTHINDCYYMVSFSEEHDKVIARRLDRMEQVLDTCMDGAVNAKINAFDLEDFECTQFGMFLGISKLITLQVNEQKMMNPLYDHFGDRLKGHVAVNPDGKTARVRVKVIDSPQFRGWIAGMDGKIEVVERQPDTPQ